jgi:hypothetical protein
LIIKPRIRAKLSSQEKEVIFKPGKEAEASIPGKRGDS